MNSRVHYIDNLRTSTVSLLIIYHIAMAYNTWGEANYIFFGSVKPVASIVVFISPWFMPFMFLLAGIGAFYSLNKRNCASFIKERLIRLGIPLIFGLLFLNPILSYIADVTHNGFSGNYLEHYRIYFTRVTDLSGYDGGFTLGHLWFIAVLIMISIFSCGIIKMLPKSPPSKSRIVIIAVLIAAGIATFDVKFFGKPLITYICIYLLGYYFFSNQELIKRLTRYKWIFASVFLLASIMNVLLFVFIGQYEWLNNICNYLSFISGIPALLCLGREYLNAANRFSRACSRLSYVFYIIHFPIVVLCQYFVSLSGIGIIPNLAISFVISAIMTSVLCLLIDTNAITRILFGIKKNKDNQDMVLK